MLFIRLTIPKNACEPDEYDLPIFINMEKVINIFRLPEDSYTHIIYNEDEYKFFETLVKETPEQILEMALIEKFKMDASL